MEACVEFELGAVEAGAELTISRCGFMALAPARRAALRFNEGGWATRLESVAGHVSSR
jgi:hypothetical protein